MTATTAQDANAILLIQSHDLLKTLIVKVPLRAICVARLFCSQQIMTATTAQDANAILLMQSHDLLKTLIVKVPLRAICVAKFLLPGVPT
ncbi:MAG: hypothetical protein FWC54_00045 [Actinomycetia bacterium]|nr:hypothetical protein [Actinomycetes bacterium]